jgi:hypothetical protein
MPGQADAYAGFNRLYDAGRKPGPITEAMCWAHARRKFFDLARLSKAPIAIEASNASMLCLPSSATSTESHHGNAGAFATSTAGHSSPSWRSGCASSAPSSQPAIRSPRPPPTASTAGAASPVSWTMAGCACLTTPPSGHCVVLPSAAAIGLLQDRTTAAGAPQPSTR